MKNMKTLAVTALVMMLCVTAVGIMASDETEAVEATYTLTYDANGGTGTVDPVTGLAATATTPVAAGTAVTKTGYTFDGWNTAADGSGTKYAAAATLTIASANVTLYAQWKAIASVVTFDVNGGTLEAVTGMTGSTLAVSYGSTYGDLPTATKAGFKFTGWFTTATGGTEVLGTALVSSTSAQTLYAQYTAVYAATFVTGQEGMIVDKQTVDTGSKFTAPALAKIGFRFDGWYTSTDNGATLSAKSYDFTVIPVADVTLYAKWTALTPFDVTFVPNNGSANIVRVVYAGSSIPSLTPEKEGLAFTGWFTDKSLESRYDATLAVTADITLYAGYAAAEEDDGLSDYDLAIIIGAVIFIVFLLVAIKLPVAVIISGVGAIVAIAAFVLQRFG